MNFNFKLIRNEMLAPGDIFWQKKSGQNLLISKKGDAINFELIKKLEAAQQTLTIENLIDPDVRHEFEAVYEKYCSEVLMRDKIKWREQLIELLRVEFIEKEIEQFELNMLAWKFFSKFSTEEGFAFIERDSELFKRHLSVASSYAFCAFLLGYYESDFLSRLFSSTLESLMHLGESVNVMSLKEKLDYLSFQESFLPEDFEVMKEIASDDVLTKSVLFEKYDGSGIRNINSREMSDLEIVMVALNSSYGFKKCLDKNVLLAIDCGDFKCEGKTQRLLKRVLMKKERTADVAA